MVFLTMGIVDQWIFRGHWKEPHVRPAYHRRRRSIVYSAFWRFLAILLLFISARFIYLNHPLYRGDFYAPFRQSFFPIFLKVYLLLGFPYMMATLKWRGGQRAEFKDPALHVLIWLRAVGRMILRKGSQRHIWVNSRCKIVALGFLVEFFYLPIMTVFLHNQFSDFSGWLTRLYGFNGSGNFSDTCYFTAYHGIYLMDVLLAMGGYAVPLRWLDNKIQSVEPTVLGWVSALVCYPPFDMVANTYLAYGPSSGHWLRPGMGLFTLLRVLTLVFAGIYASATMMFGTRFSNLTDRGILTRGPYGVVRHPAYIAKNLSWWCEKISTMDNPWNALTLGLWNLIYALRAWTEERHLRRDPVYGEYCKKVKYRFIPGLL